MRKAKTFIILSAVLMTLLAFRPAMASDYLRVELGHSYLSPVHLSFGYLNWGRHLHGPRFWPKTHYRAKHRFSHRADRWRYDRPWRYDRSWRNDRRYGKHERSHRDRYADRWDDRGHRQWREDRRGENRGRH